MKKKELPENKVVFSIGEVADYLGVRESTLRFWEKEFPLLKPKRFGGERKYNRKDIELLDKIYYLLKVRKLKIEAAKEELKTYNSRKKTLVKEELKLLDDLQNIRQKLVWLKKMLSADD